MREKSSGGCFVFGLFVFVLIVPRITAAQTSPSTISATIQVDVSKAVGDMKPIWRFFGADEPNYVYKKDGKRLIGELGKLGPRGGFFRTHNLLSTGDGTPALKWGSTNAYTEDAAGHPVYDWTILDHIFGTYLDAGMKPYLQIGFMPEALSTHPEPYKPVWGPTDAYNKIFTGWSYPPKDYSKWGELVHQLAMHCVEKYGQPEVDKWYWEVWNEANGGYWHGTPEEFQHLHDVAMDAVRRALPTARIGGPDTAGAGGKFMRSFLDHCLHGKNYATGEVGTPLDFLSFHAKGAPTFVDGHVRMSISNQLRTIEDAFKIFADFPELKTKPIVIGESDPDGCAACQGSQLGYRNGTMYSSYTAACYARKYLLADKYGVNLEGATTWAFEFEDQPFFAGFRVLSSNGLDLPVLNVFRMFGKMSGQRVATTSSSAIPLDQMIKQGVRGNADISALASAADGKVFVMIWYYHDDDLPGPDAAVALNIAGLPADARKANVTEYIIDQDHSNSFTAWKKMGSPAQPSPAQFAKLQDAGKLTEAAAPAVVDVADGKTAIQAMLSRQAVALFVIERR